MKAQRQSVTLKQSHFYNSFCVVSKIGLFAWKQQEIQVTGSQVLSRCQAVCVTIQGEYSMSVIGERNWGGYSQTEVLLEQTNEKYTHIFGGEAPS
jgi:hypothetical protein